MEHVQVIGAGLMGTGIAEVCARSGYKVTLIDLNEEQLKKAQSRLSQKLTPAEYNAVAFSPTVSKESSLLLIEAVVESLPLKEKLWRNIDPSKIDILASNTSSYSISQLASFTSAPGKFIGIHFMNPVPKMPLVEVICGEHTSQEIYSKALSFVESLTKTTVSSKDSPGFIVNRILLPMINEAIRLFEEGVASAKDIDTAMRLGANHPLGPLALADLIGLDTCLAIIKDLEQRIEGGKYTPSKLLEDMVSKGELGRKSGKGFFSYA